MFMLVFILDRTLGVSVCRCPSCFFNMVNLFCELTCGPHQSQFMNATEISNNNVVQLTYYIGKTFANGQFISGARFV